MLTRAFSIAALSAAASIVLTVNAATAATKKRNSTPSPQAQCAKQVGMVYDEYRRGWYWTSRKAGTPQESAFYDCLDALTNHRVTTTGTTAQQTKSQPRKATKAKLGPAVEEKRSLFSGNESKIAAMNYVNRDCSSGPRPDVRIVTLPSNGTIRLEPIAHVLDRKKKNSRSHCNGKTVDAVGVFYKSKPNYTGADKVILDVDFRHGTVNRYTYAIEVR